MLANISQNEYVKVLQSEIAILRQQYYKPEEEGTGHFNTAISVLEHRIKDILKTK